MYKEPGSINELTSDKVILVGRIELVPKLEAKEQDIKIGFDPFGAKDHFVNRAALYLSTKPTYRERTMEVMNPALEKTFFISIPKDRKYMVEGVVMMQYSHKAMSRRQVQVDTNELVIPPISFDIKPNDKAVYVGTLQVHRDEFNEVNKVVVLDDYSRAATELKKKFGSGIAMRKALAKPLVTSKP